MPRDRISSFQLVEATVPRVLPMDVEILKTVAQAAGIGGVALGVLLLLFGDIIRKQIFPQLAKKDAYRLLRLISTFVFLIAAIGIGAWVWTETDSDIVLGDQIDADCSAVNTGIIEDAQINVDCEQDDNAN